VLSIVLRLVLDSFFGFFRSFLVFNLNLSKPLGDSGSALVSRLLSAFNLSLDFLDFKLKLLKMPPGLYNKNKPNNMETKKMHTSILQTRISYKIKLLKY